MTNERHPLYSPRSRGKSGRRQSILASCGECRKETNQELVWVIEKNPAHIYEFIQCSGCNSASLIDRIDDGVMWIVQQYPPIQLRPLPYWIKEFEPADFVEDPKDSKSFRFRGSSDPLTYEERLVTLLREVYGALASHHCRIAALGMRALLEEAIVSKIGDFGSFKKTWNSFIPKGMSH